MKSVIGVVAFVVSVLAVPAAVAADPPKAPARDTRPSRSATKVAGPEEAPAVSNDELDQRLKILERKLENADEEAAAKSKSATTATASDKTFSIKSADGAYELKFRGLLQVDGRFFVADPAGTGALTDTFLLRRVEPSFELLLGKIGFFRLQPQFAGDSASASDVYGELRFHPAASLRFGKFKTPLGLENLQSTPSIVFVERGLPTEVGAGRDIGLQLFGELFAGTTTYGLAFTNGTPDGRDAAAQDTDNRKEVSGRVFFEPFKNEPGFFRGLGFGIGATHGTKLNTVGTNATTVTNNFNNSLPRYRSPGQNTIFTYLASTTAPTAANTVVANGDHDRLSPQLYFYRGGFGLLGEWLQSKQDVAIGGVNEQFEHRAYQGVASYLLTGEDAFYKGVKPLNPYTIDGPGWGAFEVAVRYGVLDIDDGVFPVYANPAASVSEARSAGVALNWYLTGNARITADYEDTDFSGGAAGGDRDREQAALVRFQLSY